VSVWQSETTLPSGHLLPASGFGFQQQHRLCTRDFVAVLRGGRLLRGNGISVLLGGSDAGQSRLGLIVPKRILQRAVDRNRVKRVLREWFRHSRERLAGRDCVIRLTPARTKGPAIKLNDGSLLAELERIMPRKAVQSVGV